MTVQNYSVNKCERCNKRIKLSFNNNEKALSCPNCSLLIYNKNYNKENKKEELKTMETEKKEETAKVMKKEDLVKSADKTIKLLQMDGLTPEEVKKVLCCCIRSTRPAVKAKKEKKEKAKK